MHDVFSKKRTSASMFQDLFVIDGPSRRTIDALDNNRGGVPIGGTSTCGEEVLPPSGPPGREDRGNALPEPVTCGSGIFPRVIGSADAMDPERIYRIVRPFVLNGCPRLMGVGARPDGSLVGPWTILLERGRSGVEGLDAGRWFSYAVSCGVTSVVPCLLCDGDEPVAVPASAFYGEC